MNSITGKRQGRTVSRMEIKYCERCGTYLGCVKKSKRFCSECLRIREKESQKSPKRPQIVACAWCGKPLKQKVNYQKYHPECAFEAKKENSKLRNREIKAEEKRKVEEARQRVGRPLTLPVYHEPTGRYFEKQQPLKASRSKPKYNVWQVQMLADRRGIHYWQASMGLENGTLTMDEDIASGKIKRKPN